MDRPAIPTFIADRIVLRDLNAGLSAESRLAAVEKIARLVQQADDVVQIRVDLERDEHAVSDEHRFIAKGELVVTGPGVLASVASNEPLRSLDFLLERFDRQLRRRARALPRLAAR